MIPCPGCGSSLRFDIPSQLMACDYCGNFYNPYDFDPNPEGAEEAKFFDTTVFHCPNCGGEVFSTDDSITGFCNFCGSSVLFSTRMEKTGRPGFIIPFTVTKEDCKQSYASMMKKAIFAPKELRDPKYIDGFRGIYMPYWSYYITQKNTIYIHGEKSHRSGDYIITDNYSLSEDLDAYYKGISYDASSSFDDNISEALAPYDVKGMKAFTPAYLSGFYADTADLDSSIYESEAIDFATKETLKNVAKTTAFRGYNPDFSKLNPSTLGTGVETVDYSMFPVWFLSYRNKDRVAYATVNGQTGKVVTDIPIDPKRYLLFSLLLAIPIFGILFLDMAMLPSTGMLITAFIALATLFVFSKELKAIMKREAHEDDMGYLAKHDPAKMHKMQNEAHRKSKSKKSKKRSSVIPAIIIGLFCGFEFIYAGFYVVIEIVKQLFSGSNGLDILFWLILLGLAIALNAVIGKRYSQIPNRKGSVGVIFTLVSIILCGVIRILNVISYSSAALYMPIFAYDWWFYAGTLLLIVSMFVTLADIIRYYNVLSTRALPQFEHQGGDDRA